MKFIIVSICSHIAAARSTRAFDGPFRTSNKLRTDRNARSFWMSAGTAAGLIGIRQ
ncbi:hypothetical protein IFT54_19450 [Sphingomonas sp. CFBP 13714]|uniref:hypothetical protein n=1 Tax=Sphingomonas sp. CFBP 13714 TaxID=2775308 RepID=UPI00177F1317|nr:hypothetical protein [Sphingomonas sp. CFBP 13714]MBD8701988.1 hypothetical protein [Sphingomonas sp. CFBP 13714]